MMALIIAIHIIACILLIGIVLIQQGRGGGLVESFSGVESMFGTKTNAFLTRATAVLSVMFFVTCLGLAFMSSRQSRSLMTNIPVKEQPQQKTAPEQINKEAAPQPQAAQEQVPPKTSSVE